MKALDLRKGSKIEISSNGKDFKEATVTRTTASFIWFDGSGYERIARTTIDKYNCFYRILSL
jgi:translation elongation factor P/translation initiation factor 5A